MADEVYVCVESDAVFRVGLTLRLDFTLGDRDRDWLCSVGAVYENGLERAVWGGGGGGGQFCPSPAPSDGSGVAFRV